MISKSSFIRGMQCQKSLWLHFYRPEERDEISQSQQQIFDNGHNVGLLAQQLFEGGVDASRGEYDKVNEAVAYTAALIDGGQDVIYEAAFSDGETLCYMDILVKEGHGWTAYEVKASTQVKEYQIKDAAFQYYVITRSGLPLKRISLVHINNQYVRHGELDLQQLFTIEQMTRRILPMQKDIPAAVLSLQQMLKTELIPDISMGPQCNKPFACDFVDFCRQGHLANDETADEKLARRDQHALDEFLDQLSYPLYFLDFETIQFAVPRYDESRPYQQIPFQYSLHVRQTKYGPVEHYEFLGIPPTDPRPEFIQTLLTRTGENGSIIAWNQAFEKTRLKEIARDFPEYACRIERLFDRFNDLMVPFRKKHLYMPAMNGSYSLKAVLPALIPDLTYSDLNIQEGGAASLTYESLYYDEEPESVRLKRDHLLAYCRMDTWSMVKILEKLQM